jgi:hypothetical protein
MVLASATAIAQTPYSNQNINRQQMIPAQAAPLVERPMHSRNVGWQQSGPSATNVAAKSALANWGFETGDFTSWVTKDMAVPYSPLTVAGAGNSAYSFLSAPTEGSSSVQHGFDGGGPDTIEVAQDITIPGATTARLLFDYRAAWNNGGTQDRVFTVQVQPSGGGAPLQASTILTAAFGTTNPDTGVLTGTVNLDAFAGQTVRVVFHWNIPEFLTGPAFFELDNVRLFGNDLAARDVSPAPLTCMAADPTTGIIYAQQNNSTAFYRYDPFRDTWEALASAPTSSGNNGGAAYLAGKIYTTYTTNNDLGVYDIATNSWTSLTNDPAFFTGNIASDGRYLYLVIGTTFKRYDPVGASWTTLATPGISFQPWGGMDYWNGTLYAHVGNSFTDFAKYDIAANSWTTLASLPDGAGLGSAIDPVGRVYFAYGNYGIVNKIYAFDLQTETWSTLGPAPWPSVFDGGMAHVGKAGQGGIFIIEGELGTGVLQIETSTSVPPGKLYQTSLDPVGPFSVYHPGTDSWRRLRRYDTGAQMAVGVSGALFAYRRNPAQIEVYDPASDSWSFAISSPAGAAGNYGNLEVTPGGEFLYSEQANSDHYYRNSGGSWITNVLGFNANAQGDYDPFTGDYVIGEDWAAHAHLITVDEFSFGKTSFTAGPGATGEIKRFGVAMDGRYFYQGWTDPVRAYDLSNPALPGTNVVTVAGSNWLSGSADRMAGTIFSNSLFGGPLNLIDPVSLTITPLASGPTFSNHSSIAFSDDLMGVGKLYFSQGANAMGLWVLDPATGAGTWVGAAAPNPGALNSGLTVSDETDLFIAHPFGVRKTALDGRGAGGLDIGTYVEGLAYNVTSGQLFSANDSAFFELDPATGAILATLSSPGFDIEGLAAAPNHNVIYGIGDTNWLMVYDVATDFWNIVGNTGLTWNNAGLAYDPATHELYAISDDNGPNLYTIDPDTGVATLVGPTGIPGIADGGLAFAPGLIFADGFESGNTSAWSNTVP